MKNTKETILKKHWWYDSFRWKQSEAIEELLNWNDVIYVAATWDWKSICFQIPAILKEWTTIVISPLKSLMKNQVDNLTEKWISATYINSDLTFEESKDRYLKLLNWEYHLLYISPEKFSSDSFKDSLSKIEGWINYFIVDEFDTIDEYGSSWFRPEYLELWKIKKELEEKIWKRIPVWVFTATATPKMQEKVIEILDMNNSKRFIWNLIWEHIKIDIRKYKTKDEKDSELYELLKKIKKENNWIAIIFCSTIKDVDWLYQQLNSLKFKVWKYNWKMSTVRKESNYKKFINNEIDFIVCTNAFWRWIDKSDIRNVIHYWIPWNISSYLQEIWRAGRDRKNSNAILFYSWKDIVTRKFILGYNTEAKNEFNELIELFENWNCILSNIKEKFWHSYDLKEKCNQCFICNPEFHFELNWNNDFSVKKIKRKTSKRKKTSSVKKTSSKYSKIKKSRKTKKRVSKKNKKN